MSTEQDKDTFSLKRNRGGDGGLDGLGGPGLLLGSPDKKKRKSSTQAPPHAPLSEYAPPPNPSADHLVAANPFDDSYNVPSYKPLTSGNPYFGHSHYPGFGGYGAHRMAPHVPSRMPSPYGGAYQMRNQPHPFVQNPVGMGFNRPPGFNYGHLDNPNYGNQPMFNNNSNMPFPSNQPLRPGSGDNLNQMPPLNVNQIAGPDAGPGFGPEGNVGGNPPPKPCMDMSPGLPQQQQQQQQPQQQNNFSQSTTPIHKQDSSETSSKNASQCESPRKQSRSSEENTCSDNAAELKAKSRGGPGALEGGLEKLNGIIHQNNESLKKSPQSNAPVETPTSERNRRSSSSGGAGGAGQTKAPAHPHRLSSSSTEPVYPCGICLNEVNDDQEAILCEASCQKWFHRVCTGMTETAYNLLTAEASAVWGCDTCMEEKGAQLLKMRETPGLAIVNSEGQS
ncbi:pygopus homolog 1 [Chanos chanos]|uniref:Pygopus homolog 1 n=1 Tax=Chanos chanos TaxID=29144 RepID=A0A6J2URZ5_CHACN|nr:pygopus homolog 1 [Chanos chanos]